MDGSNKKISRQKRFAKGKKLSKKVEISSNSVQHYQWGTISKRVHLSISTMFITRRTKLSVERNSQRDM